MRILTATRHSFSAYIDAKRADGRAKYLLGGYNELRENVQTQQAVWFLKPT